MPTQIWGTHKDHIKRHSAINTLIWIQIHLHCLCQWVWILWLDLPVPPVHLHCPCHDLPALMGHSSQVAPTTLSPAQGLSKTVSSQPFPAGYNSPRTAPSLAQRQTQGRRSNLCFREAIHHLPVTVPGNREHGEGSRTQKSHRRADHLTQTTAPTGGAVRAGGWPSGRQLSISCMVAQSLEPQSLSLSSISV